MANALWKRFEKSTPYGRAKLLFKRITGRELWLKPELDRVTVECADWRFLPDALGAEAMVYSLGVGDDVSFDLALIENYGATVHAFDPTPASARWLTERDLPAKFCFHPWAVTANDGSIMLYPRIRRDGSASEVMYTVLEGDEPRDDGIVVPAFCIPTLLAKLGHQRIDLLKMDIEGAEYEVLDNLLASECRPRQLLVEFHHRFTGIGKKRTAAALGKLQGAGYRIFAVSGTGREVSLLHTPG